ncbi:MAG: carbohydrate kinase [bacterium]
MSKKFDIIALGEILIDFTFVDIKEGKKLFQQNPGGAVANVLVSATNLGSKTGFIGKAGLDMHGNFLKDTLVSANVNVSGFILDSNFFTTLAFVDLDEFKERTFSFARKPGADTQLTIEDLNIDLIKDTKILHVGSLSLTHEPVRSTTYKAIEIAKENGSIISYDPNYRASLWSSVEEASKYMKSIIPNIMKLSDDEVELLTDCDNYIDAAKYLFNKGIKVVVVTLGKDGCYVYNKEGGALVSGFKSEVIDTTGAGDAFWGAFLNKISENGIDSNLDDLKEYARFANATASLCVQKYGAIPAMPSLEEVKKRLK